SADLDRIEDRLLRAIESALDEIQKRNDFDMARDFATHLESKTAKRIRSWVKVGGPLNTDARATPKERDEREEEEFILPENPDKVTDNVISADDGPVAENLPTNDQPTPENFSGVDMPNSAESNDLENRVFEIVENCPDAEDAENTPTIEGSINFDSPLE